MTHKLTAGMAMFVSIITLLIVTTVFFGDGFGITGHAVVVDNADCGSKLSEVASGTFLVYGMIFELTENMGCSNEHGLIADIDGATIDCKGFTIDGNDASGTYGINIAQGNHSITVKNCKIKDFEVGIRVQNSAGNKIKNTNVSSNQYGITLYNVNFTSIINVRAFSNVDGTPGRGISFTSGRKVNITQSTIYSNTNEGIYLNGADDCILSGNTIYDNDMGMYFYNLAGPIIQDNLLRDNDVDGIRFNTVTSGKILRNKAYNNTNQGVHLHGGSNHLVENNSAMDNGGDGIYTYNSEGNTIYNNMVATNDVNGIDLNGNSGSTVRKNRAYDNGGHGIHAQSGADYNTISQNEVYGNSQRGIQVYNSDSNTINNNIVWGNSDIAIYVQAASSENNIVTNNFVNNSVGDITDSATGSSIWLNNVYGGGISTGLATNPDCCENNQGNNYNYASQSHCTAECAPIAPIITTYSQANKSTLSVAGYVNRTGIDAKVKYFTYPEDNEYWAYTYPDVSDTSYFVKRCRVSNAAGKPAGSQTLRINCIGVTNSHFIEFQNHKRTGMLRYDIHDASITGTETDLVLSELLQAPIVYNEYVYVYDKQKPTGWYNITGTLSPGYTMVRTWGEDGPVPGPYTSFLVLYSVGGNLSWSDFANSLTTNFSNPALNKSAIPNATIGLPTKGMINYSGQILNLTGADLNSLINISTNYIEVKSHLFPNLNKPARLTFFNLNYVYPPLPLKNGTLCTSCSARTWNVKNYSFDVTGFTAYSTGANSKLVIWDIGDLGTTVYTNSSFFIYANYTNHTSGDFIPNATCKVTCAMGTETMENISSPYPLYAIEAQFSAPGTYDYTINCSKDGFEKLTLTDSVVVVPDNVPPIKPRIWPMEATTTQSTINVIGWINETNITIYAQVLNPAPYGTYSQLTTQDSNLKSRSRVVGNWPAGTNFVRVDGTSASVGQYIEFEGHNKSYFSRYRIVGTVLNTPYKFLNLSENLSADVKDYERYWIYDTKYPAGWFNLSVGLQLGKSTLEVWGVDLGGNPSTHHITNVTRTFTPYAKYTRFSPSLTTDFNNVFVVPNPACVNNAMVGIVGLAWIRFNRNCLDFKGIDLDSYLNMTHNFVDFISAERIEQLTNRTGGQHINPSVYGDLIAYEAFDGHAYDIYVYNLSNRVETKITDGSKSNSNPVIDGNYIVWHGSVSGDYNIYLYNLSNGVETQITSNTQVQWYPDISGNIIVWADFRPGNYDIYMYNLSNGVETALIVDPSSQRYPQIDGDLVIWEDLRDANYEIYIYNLSNGQETRLTSDGYAQNKPAIDGDVMAWSWRSITQYAVQIYNLSTNTTYTLTGSSLYRTEPQIMGDKVVYQAYPAGAAASNYDIYLYDISAGIEHPISAEISSQENPFIYGDIVAWGGNQTGWWNLYTFNISSGVFWPNSLMSKINVSSTITFFNLSYKYKPAPLVNGRACPITLCNQTVYDGKNFTFKVKHFTNYSTSANSYMLVWDDTDYGDLKYRNETVRFYAAYRNTSSDGSITGANCKISFDGGTANTMSYSTFNRSYFFDKKFTLGGMHNYSVTCNKTGFETITINNTAYISNIGPPIAPILWNLTGVTRVGFIDVIGYSNESGLNVTVFTRQDDARHDTDQIVNWSSEFVGSSLLTSARDKNRTIIWITEGDEVYFQNSSHYLDFDSHDLEYFFRYDITGATDDVGQEPNVTFTPGLIRALPAGERVSVYDTNRPSGWFNLSLRLWPGWNNVSAVSVRNNYEGSVFSPPQYLYYDAWAPGFNLSGTHNTVLDNQHHTFTVNDDYGINISSLRVSATRFYDVDWTDSGTYDLVRITNNSYDQEKADIYGDYVVYMDERNGNYDIFLYDLGSGFEKQLTFNSSDQLNPRIYGDIVVYEDRQYSAIGTFGSEISIYNLSNDRETRITTENLDQKNPDIYLDLIVWDDARTGVTDIYMYNLSNGQESVITSASGSQINPRIHENTIVWQDSRGADYDIYIYNLSSGSERALVTATGTQQLPLVHSSLVAWEDLRTGSDQFRVHDLVSGTETIVPVVNLLGVGFADIYGDVLVWEQRTTGNDEIYLHDLSSNTTTRLTTDSSEDESPAIYQDTIVWQTNRTGNFDIFEFRPVSNTTYHMYNSSNFEGFDQVGTNITCLPSGGTFYLCSFTTDLVVDDYRFAFDVYDLAGNRNITYKDITIYQTLGVLFNVIDGFIDETGGYHVADLTNKRLLFANWTLPAGIGIERFEVALGQAAYGQAGWNVIQTWKNVGLNMTFNITIPKITSVTFGFPYIFHVRAWTDTQNYTPVRSSNGIIFEDDTPPICTNNGNCVFDYGSFAGNFSQDAATLRASWVFDDNQSMITMYEYAIGSAKPPTAVNGSILQGYPPSLGFNNVTAVTQTSVNGVTRNNLDLSEGAWYYFSVRARNIYNKWTAWYYSDGIQIDTQPPENGSITYPEGFVSLNNITVDFDIGVDAISGIDDNQDVYLLVASVPINPDNFTCPSSFSGFWSEHINSYTVGLQSLVYDTTPGYCYKFRLQVTDRAHNTRVYYSKAAAMDGIVINDVTPPGGFKVYDEGFSTMQRDNLYVYWDPSEDNESGILYYEYALSRCYANNCNNLDNFTGWTAIAGTRTDALITNLSLSDEFKYFVRVRAWNRVGLSTEAITDGIIFIDNTPPTTTLISIENDTNSTDGYLDHSSNANTTVMIRSNEELNDCVYLYTNTGYSPYGQHCQITGRNATCSIPESQGINEYYIFCTDISGNEQLEGLQAVYTVDTLGPKVIVTDPEENNTVGGWVQFTVDIEDDSYLGTVRYFIYNSTNVLIANVSAPLYQPNKTTDITALLSWDSMNYTNGTEYMRIEVYVNDTWGYVGNTTRHFYLDNTIPAITFRFPNYDNRFFNGGNFTLNISVQNFVNTTYAIFNSTGQLLQNNSNTSNQTRSQFYWNDKVDISDWPDGSYKISVMAVGAFAGKQNNKSFEFFIDRTPPAYDWFNKTPDPIYVTMVAVINVRWPNEFNLVANRYDIEEIYLNYSVNNLSWSLIPMIPVGPYNDTFRISIGPFQNNDTIYWYSIAKDFAGNWNKTMPMQSFKIWNRAPVLNETMPPLVWDEQSSYTNLSLSDYFYDLDNDTLIYSAVLLPKGTLLYDPLDNKSETYARYGGLTDVDYVPGRTGNGALIEKTRQNLIINPDFENGTTQPIVWTAIGLPLYNRSGASFEGDDAVFVNVNNYYTQRVTVSPTEVYTLSEYITTPDGDRYGRLQINWYSDSGFISTTVCQTNWPLQNCTATPLINSSYTRYQLSTTPPSNAEYADIVISSHNASYIVVDAVQFELGDYATSFLDGTELGGAIIYATRYNNITENFNKAEGTMEFWIMPEWDGNDSSTNLLVDLDFADYLILAKSGSEIYFGIVGLNATSNSSVAITNASIASWKKGEWHFVTAVYDDSMIGLYLDDGSINSTLNHSITLPLPPTNIYLGSSSGLNDQADATMDDFAIFDYAKSWQEVINSYVNGTLSGVMMDITLEQADGNVTLTPNPLWSPGERRAQFFAADPFEGKTGSNIVKLIVRNILDAPNVTFTVSQVYFDEDTYNHSIDLDNHVFFPELEALTWSYHGNTHIHVNITPNNTVIFTADLNWNGNETINFTACNSLGACDSDLLDVIVLPVNDQPYIPDGAPRSITFDEDNSSLLNLNELCGDYDFDYLSFHWNFNEIRITSDGGNQIYSPIYKNIIVWMDQRAGNYDIRMFNLSDSQESVIADGPSDQVYPYVYEGLVVFQDDRAGNYDIYMYNTSNGIETRITTNTSDQTMPSINSNIIIWVDERGGTTSIYMYNMSNRNTTRLLSSVSMANIDSVFGETPYPPRMDNQYIVFQDNRSTNFDVYLYNFSNRQQKRITTSTANQSMPSIEGDIIVWRDDRDGNWDIYMYNLSSGNQTQITNDTSPQEMPYIKNGLISWHDLRLPLSGTDIYYYNLSNRKETRATKSSLLELLPLSYGNILTWSDNRNGDSDIYALNLSRNNGENISVRITNLEEIKLTNSTADQSYPSVYGDFVVWSDNRTGSLDIYLQNISSGIERQITNNTWDQKSPSIYGNRIVWMDNRNGNWDIYSYDISTGITRQITTNPSIQAYPEIYSNRIVWHDFRNNNWDIYSYDLSTSLEQQLTSQSSLQAYPSIYGNLVVWQDNRNNKWQIYMRNISNGIESLLVNNVSSQSFPQIYDKRVVWMDNRTGNNDIYMHDIAKNTTTQIVGDASAQYSPSIYGNTIVWHDNRNGNLDIYMYNLLNQEETRLTTNTSDQSFASVYGSTIVWMDKRNGNWDIYKIDTSGPFANFTAPANWNGVNYITIYCNDSELQTPVQFDVIVEPVDDVPIVSFSTILNHVFFDEDKYNESVDLDDYMTNPDGDAITWLVSGNANISVDILDNRVVRLTSEDNWYGNETINFTACDTTGNCGSDLLNVTVLPINDAPYIIGGVSTDINFTEDGNTTLNLSSICGDYEGDNLTFSWDYTKIYYNEQIVANISGSNYPAIYGDVVVWQDNRSKHWDIYAYNLSSKSEARITTDISNQLFPAIYGSLIVWTDDRNGDHDLYMYNISNQKETRLTTDISNQRFPKIHENLLVWHDFRNNNWDIYLLNLSTGMEMQITTNTSSQLSPMVYNDIVVWQDNRHGDWEIYMYNLSNGLETRVTNNTQQQISPSVYNNIIAWQDDRNGNYDIYMYNISNSQESQLTYQLSDQLFHSIYGSRIIWVDDRNDEYDIYMYNISDGMETRLTINRGYKDSPQMYGELLVWQDFSNNQKGIYVMNISSWSTINNVSMTINHSNSFANISAEYQWSGNSYINVYCNDSQLLTPVMFGVFVQPIPDAPIILPIPSQTIMEDLHFMLNLSDYVFDWDLPLGDSITWTLLNFPPWGMSIVNESNISWIPTNWDVGNWTITVRATDMYSLTNESTFNITVLNVNDAPWLDTRMQLPDASEGVMYNYTLDAGDIDPTNDTVEFELLLAPAGMNINTSTGKLNWTPTHNQRARYYNVTVQVDDTVNASNRTYLIYVRDITPPIITVSSPLNNSYNYKSVILNVTTDENATCTYWDSHTNVWAAIPGGLNTTHLKNITFTGNTTHDVIIRCVDNHTQQSQLGMTFYIVDTPFRLGYFRRVPGLIYVNQTVKMEIGLLALNDLSALNLTIFRPDLGTNYFTNLDMSNTTMAQYIMFKFNYTATNVTGNYTAFLQVNGTQGRYANATINFKVHPKIIQVLNVK